MSARLPTDLIATSLSLSTGDHQKRYEFFFCNGQQRVFRSKVQWDASGSSNLKELNSHAASHILRRTKEECLKGLPPRKREWKRIPVAPRHELRYAQAMQDLGQVVNSSHAGRMGDENEEVLNVLHRLRQISSSSKVDAVVQLSNSICVEESSIVIFTFYVKVAKEIQERLSDMEWNVELLTGEVNQCRRQEMVDRFQSGLSPVFICTYGAGSVGLTLTGESPRFFNCFRGNTPLTHTLVAFILSCVHHHSC